MDENTTYDRSLDFNVGDRCLFMGTHPRIKSHTAVTVVKIDDYAIFVETPGGEVIDVQGNDLTKAIVS